ncbi:MAG: YitT family protein [Candidatus Gastranaerophilaceae bacterium]
MTIFFKKKPKKVVVKSKRQILKESVISLLFITFGALIAAFALECFLLPNDIIDGGVIGLSMMTSYITKWNLGLIIVIFNIPFIYLALQKMGKKFVFNVFYGIMMLALFLNLLSGYKVTEVPLLATVFGGIILGTGVGLILRNDGALDGTEILAIRLAKRFGFSVGEIIMFFNVFIYTAAGTLYGWDSAMYSILTYFIVYKVIDVVLEGLNSSKSAQIISNHPKEIGDAIIRDLDISVTYLKAKGGYSGQEKIIVYCVINRLEVAKMKKLIRDIDPEAFLVIQGVHEVEGVRVKKK